MWFFQQFCGLVSLSFSFFYCSLFFVREKTFLVCEKIFFFKLMVKFLLKSFSLFIFLTKNPTNIFSIFFCFTFFLASFFIFFSFITFSFSFFVNPFLLFSPFFCFLSLLHPFFLYFSFSVFLFLFFYLMFLFFFCFFHRRFCVSSFFVLLTHFFFSLFCSWSHCSFLPFLYFFLRFIIFPNQIQKNVPLFYFDIFFFEIPCSSFFSLRFFCHDEISAKKIFVFSVLFVSLFSFQHFSFFLSFLFSLTIFPFVFLFILFCFLLLFLFSPSPFFLFLYLRVSLFSISCLFSFSIAVFACLLLVLTHLFFSLSLFCSWSHSSFLLSLLFSSFPFFPKPNGKIFVFRTNMSFF